MVEIKRISPVTFKSTALKTEKRDNWDIVLEYEKEGNGPYLVDLSHCPRFDLQDAAIGSYTPLGISIPETPGKSVLKDGTLINRMNGTQASVFCLGSEKKDAPQEPGYTDVTECTVCVAIIGEKTFSICEKLTALDFMSPEYEPPFLLQGPFSHVPCQIITLGKTGPDAGIILTCSRGYGRDMIHAITGAGKEFGLKPAGETRASEWIKNM